MIIYELNVLLMAGDVGLFIQEVVIVYYTNFFVHLGVLNTNKISTKNCDFCIERCVAFNWWCLAQSIISDLRSPHLVVTLASFMHDSLFQCNACSSYPGLTEVIGSEIVIKLS